MSAAHYARFDGKAAFSMVAVPLADLPETSPGMILSIDGATIPVVLSAEDRASLRQQLGESAARKQDALAAKLWRTHFGKCQELIRAVRRLELVFSSDFAFLRSASCW